jgi:hypothetical protein
MDDIRVPRVLGDLQVVVTSFLFGCLSKNMAILGRSNEFSAGLVLHQKLGMAGIDQLDDRGELWAFKCNVSYFVLFVSHTSCLQSLTKE